MVVARPGSYAEALQQTRAPAFKAPKIEAAEKPAPLAPALTGWTPDKVSSLYNAAHAAQAPAWVNPDILQTIDAAQNWMKQTGGAALPTEMVGLLDALPTWQEQTAEAAQPKGYWAENVAPIGQAPYANYGMSEDQWNSLSFGQKLAMRAFSTNVAAGVTTGALAGAQGGPLGAATGAVFGYSLAQIGERFPAVAKIGEAFDFLVENAVMRPIGTSALLYGAAQSGDKERLQELTGNLDKAWLAGEQVFRTNLMNTGARPENYMGAQLTPEQQQARSKEVWAGPTAPTEYTTITPDKMGTAALQEYFDRLQDGEAPEDINRDFEQRYGFEGQMTDLAARIFLDPLNYIGGLAGKGISTGGRLLGASDDFARAFDWAGPIEGSKKFREAAKLMSPDEANSLKFFEKWASPYTKEGAPKLTNLPEQFNNPISKSFGYLARQLPETKAKEFVSVVSQNLSVLGDRASRNPREFLRMIKAIADNPPEAAAELGRFAGGSEMRAAVPALRDQLPGLQRVVDDYYNPAIEQARGSLDNVAARANITTPEMIKKLIDPNTGDTYARSVLAQVADAARKSGDEGAEILRMIESGDLSPESLADMAGAFKEGGIPLNEKQLMAKMYAELIDGSAKWSAKYFGVAPDAWPVRLSNAIKSMQGAVLLDLNPTYGLQNVVDNTFKLGREGVLGFLSPKSAHNYLNDLLGEGLAPTRIAEGLISDTGVPHMRPDDAIAAAKRKPGKDIFQGAEDIASEFRRKNPISVSKASGAAEENMRLVGNVTGIKQTMNQLDRVGKGIDRMPRQLEDAIRAQGGDPRSLYRMVDGDHNVDRIVSRMFGDTPELRVDDVLDATAEAMGENSAAMRDLFDRTGVSDFLRERLPANPTRGQIAQAMGDLRDQTRKQFNDMSKEQKLARMEKAANKAQAEGPVGIFEVFDDIGIERGEQRLYDWMEWDEIWSLKGQIPEESFGTRVQMQYNYQRDVYRRLNENTRASYLGAVEKLGADSNYSRLLADNLVADEALWSGFFDTVKKEYRDFFKKRGKESYESQNARWVEVRERLAKLYDDTSTKALDLQAQRDGDLINLIGTRYGEPARAAAEAWLQGVREIDAEMYQGMKDFRDRVSKLPGDQRNKAWSDFLRKEHKPAIVERMRRNREGANEVYARASEAERMGQVNEQVQSPQPAPLRVEDIQPKPETIERVRNEMMQEQLDEAAVMQRAREIDFAEATKGTERRQPAARGMRAEIERLNGIIDQLKKDNEGLKTDPSTGLRLGTYHMDEINAAPIKMAVDVSGLGYLNDAYSHKAGDILLKNFAETIAELGHKGYRNQTGGDEFTLIFNSLEEARAAEARLHEVMRNKQIPAVSKATGQATVLTGFDVRAGIADTLEAADAAERAVKAEQNIPKGSKPPTVTELTGAGLQEALDKWSKEVGKKPAELPKIEADPDPVGIAPPGTVDGIYGHPEYDMQNQGWHEYVAPALRELERQLADPANAPTNVKGMNLDAATTNGIKTWLEQVRGQKADVKLTALKWGALSTDMAMLNYSNRRGFDNILNMFAPYQFWYTRSMMNWALTAIDKPAWFANWYRLREMQEKMQRPVPGLPARLSGKLQARIPFMPEGWGDTIFYDPWHQVFGFEAMAGQVMRPLMRDFSNTRSRAEYILQEQMQNEEISQDDYTAAINTQQGPLWEQAYQRAQAEVESEIASPVDLVSTMLAPSLPLAWALERAGLKSKGLSSTLPAFATVQNLTSFITPGGYHIPSIVQQIISGKPTDATQQDSLRNYYVMRELANMAAQGADPDAIEQAMVERQGPLWEQALGTIGRQQAVRSLGALLWADFFPEGEQRQRAIKEEFVKAADAGQLPAFFDKYPEYQSRMMLRNADDPEALMKQFLISEAWNARQALPELERKQVEGQLGELYQQAFLNKETRSYDSIDVPTLVQWVQAFRGSVPSNAPEVPQANIERPPQQTTDAFSEYRNWQQTQPGYALSNMMWDLPEGMRDQFKLMHPEIAAYSDQKYIYLSQHPELLPYAIGEDSYLAGAPIEVVAEVYDYYAERATLFPFITVTQAEYYNLPKNERSAFLRQFPELKDYWDWSKERKDMLSNAAYPYVVGESGMEKLRAGDDYEAPYRVDYDSFDPALTLALASATMTRSRLGEGAMKKLRQQWEREGKPLGSFEAWQQVVLGAFTVVPQ